MKRGLPVDRRMTYLRARLDAFSGLIFALFSETATLT